MATVRETIVATLAGLSIELSAVRMDTLLVDSDLNGEVPYTTQQKLPVKRALHSVISELLAMPDVTEGGMSLKWDRSAVEKYCNLLWVELGNVSSSAATIQDRSYLW